MISVSNTTTSFEHLQAYQDAGIPLVFFDRVCESMDVPRITTDDAEASFHATEHLLKTGCRRIAFISLSGNLSISTRRKSGYLKALAKYGFADKDVIIECGPDDESNRQKIRELLQTEPTPDGIFAAVEKSAINTYEVCRELNIRIPQQLKVISFSNLSAAALFNPPLSTIVQPAYEIGREAASVLFKIIDKKNLLLPERKIVLPSHIVVRESTTSKQYTAPPVSQKQ